MNTTQNCSRPTKSPANAAGTGRWKLFFCLLGVHQAALATPLFDAHLHFNASHAEHWSGAQIEQILQRNQIEKAAITSIPPDYVLDLQHQLPQRVVPILGVYQNAQQKQDWHRDASVPGLLQKQLENRQWRAIGELHLFAQDRHSKVFDTVVKLAVQHRLPLMLHTDPVVIDHLFERYPDASVIWAHAGAYPYPSLLQDYLQRYPNLHMDLSMRNERIAPAGELADDWELLLLQFPQRFMTGVDTFSAARWNEYDAVTKQTRHWLQQLPDEVAALIGFGNAERLYATSAPSKPTQ